MAASPQTAQTNDSGSSASSEVPLQRVCFQIPQTSQAIMRSPSSSTVLQSLHHTWGREGQRGGYRGMPQDNHVSHTSTSSLTVLHHTWAGRRSLVAEIRAGSSGKEGVGDQRRSKDRSNWKRENVP